MLDLGRSARGGARTMANNNNNNNNHNNNNNNNMNLSSCIIMYLLGSMHRPTKCNVNKTPTN